MLARRASPKAMEELIALAGTAVDEKVRAVCAIAVLDRGGVAPIGSNAKRRAADV
jgi:hypothetical protein